MADAGKTYTDKQITKLEKKINSVYAEAEKDLQAKYAEFQQKYAVKDQMWQEKIAEAKKTDPFKAIDLSIEYQDWQKGQVFQGQQWQAKLDAMAQSMTQSNQMAQNLVNNSTLGIFTENFNYAAYSLENGAGVNFGFGLYDQTTVGQLIKKEPTLLPTKHVNVPKDLAWNQKLITNQITQGIIQGERLDQIADRLGKVANMNRNSMLTNARTAMTAAQNSGRNLRLKQSKAMGIDTEKEWMATLDAHTRDSHRHIDGETQPVGDTWHKYYFSNDCEYPADPYGPAKEVYNCRCTMVCNIKDWPSEYNRYDNIEGKPIKNMTYDQWAKAKGITGKKSPVDYSKYGDKETFDILKKYGNWDDFVNNSTSEEFDKVWAQFDSTQDVQKIFKDPKTQADFKAADKATAKAEKATEAKMTKLQGNVDAVKAQMDQMVSDYGSWSGIWKEDVTLADFTAKEASIQAKREYFEERIAHLEGMFDQLDAKHLEKLEQFKDNLEALNEYEKLGKQYKALYEKYGEASKELTEFKRSIMGVDDRFSQARKDAALWAKSAKEADAALRQGTKDVWATATKEQKLAAWDYTAGSGKFNRPLRGYDGSWYDFKGVGKVDLDREGAGKEIKDLTDLLEKSTLKQDIWLQRGVDNSGLAGFLGIPESTLTSATQEELEQLLVGKEVTDTAFMSCGSKKGAGFSGNIMNIYCPEGTKAIYCEPFSQYGDGGGKNWDGISDQSYFGSELETLLQRNSTHRITKVEKSGYRIYLDTEIVGQRIP